MDNNKNYKKNNKPYNNRYNKNRNRKNNTLKNNLNNKREENVNIEKTMNIRVDQQRINDSDSLDTSFLEGRISKNQKKSKKIKDNLLKERKNSFIDSIIFKRVLYIFIFFIVVFVAFLGINYVKNNLKDINMDFSFVDKKINNNEKKEVVKDSPIVKVDSNYLFVGDFNSNRINFDDLDYYYVNSSDDNNTTKNIVDNLNENIYQYNPSIVFIQLGINDLNDNITNEEIIDNIDSIVRGIKENRPYAKIVIESVYPVNKDIDNYDDDIIIEEIDNDDIISLNKKIKNYSNKNNIKYLDIFSLLSDNNKLKEEYTENGVYLNEKGYKEVLEKINEVIG